MHKHQKELRDTYNGHSHLNHSDITSEIISWKTQTQKQHVCLSQYSKGILLLIWFRVLGTPLAENQADTQTTSEKQI